jgi:hypothetical protein
LVAFVAGYETMVLAFAGLDFALSRDPSYSFGGPVGLIMYFVVIGAIGLFILGVGLRVTRRRDSA